MNLDYNSIKEVAKRAKELDLILKKVPEDAPLSIRGHIEGEVSAAGYELGVLANQYRKNFANSVELILVSGPAESEAVKQLEALGLPAVDAMGLLSGVAKSTIELDGSTDTKITMTAYMQLLKEMKLLSRVTGLNLEIGLEYRDGDPAKSLVENLRELVNTQYGSAFAEAGWIWLYGSDLCYTKRLDETPLPVVVYNTNGANAGTYSQIFKNAHEAVFETGSKQEVTKALKEITSKLVKQGKIKQSTKKQETQGEE